MYSRPVNVSAGGEFLAATGSENQEKPLAGARLVSAAAASTMVVRETDGSGRILYALAADIGGADECGFAVSYKGKIHVTMTGAAAIGLVFEQ